MVEFLRLSCRAKINLTLEIIGERPDGYHEIASVMQALDLHDTLELQPLDGLSFTCSQPELAGEDNLVLKAARLLQSATGAREGAHLHLVKRIPVAAGLGGGSSDAAEALRGLNLLWGKPLSFAELVALAGQVGSDVPFFLFDGTALVTGRGEKVEPLPPMPPRWVVLVVPSVIIPGKTGYLYSLLSPNDYSRGAATAAVVESLRRGLSPDPSFLTNAFQAVALRHFPEIRRWHDRLLCLGASRVWLAGSGPALFTLPADEALAKELAQMVQCEGGRAFVTRTVSGETTS